MDKNFIIGIPVRDFENPMTRLSNSLNKEERIELSKSMFLNIVNSFDDENVDIYCITNNTSVVDYCTKNKIETFNAKNSGLNNEINEFINLTKDYSAWTIVHADLPYVNRHYAKVWIEECLLNEIIISESKDSGTPIIGGNKFINEFQYGEKSFIKHIELFNKKNINYKKIFNKELSFEVDDINDYKDLIKNQPRWFRKNSLLSSPDRI